MSANLFNRVRREDFESEKEYIQAHFDTKLTEEEIEMARPYINQKRSIAFFVADGAIVSDEVTKRRRGLVTAGDSVDGGRSLKLLKREDYASHKEYVQAHFVNPLNDEFFDFIKSDEQLECIVEGTLRDNPETLSIETLNLWEEPVDTALRYHMELVYTLTRGRALSSFRTPRQCRELKRLLGDHADEFRKSCEDIFACLSPEQKRKWAHVI